MLNITVGKKMKLTLTKFQEDWQNYLAKSWQCLERVYFFVPTQLFGSISTWIFSLDGGGGGTKWREMSEIKLGSRTK